MTHIAAPASQRIVIEGEGGHAGGKLMPGRKDALAAAAELILALESAAKSTGAIDTVGTVGICEVFPGAVNSVPSRVLITPTFATSTARAATAFWPRCAAHADEVSARRGVKITTELINADPPTTCDPAILAALEASAIAAGKNIQEDGGARLSRFVVRLVHCAGGHAVYSLPRRSEPPARRIRFARVDRQRRARAGAHAGEAGRIMHSL